MKVKRFFAPDMRQAMQSVREDVGPDAVIISNRRVAGGVEVVAAREQDYEVAQVEFRKKRSESRKREDQVRILTGQSAPKKAKVDPLEDELRRAKARITAAESRQSSEQTVTANRNHQIEGDDDDLETIISSLKQRQKVKAQQAHQNFVSHHTDGPALDRTSASEESSTIRAMQDELHQLKSMLEQQMSVRQSSALSDVEPSASPLEKRLRQIGLFTPLVRQLMMSVESGIPQEQAWKHLLVRLAESIPVVGEDYIERGGMIAFLGPTGAGKTTTIGKLAARYVLKYGSSGLALVTTDTYRIAAHEQLKTFGRILDVPVRVVDDQHSLDEVLQSLRNKRMVLIDTAGMSSDAPHSKDQMEMLDAVSVRMKKLLVVSCANQYQVIERGYNAYRGLKLNGCVLTKLDESGSLGEALSFVIDKGLPVAYVTDGQKVPDDISVARRSELVSRAVVVAARGYVADDVSSAKGSASSLFRAG